MAKKWRVWNRHPQGLTHTENFRDSKIVIKPNDYVLMDYEDAVRFRGQFFPMLKNAQGAPDPRGFKVIELEPHDEQSDSPEVQEFVCHFDGAKFPTQALLDSYLKQNYSENVITDPELEKEIEQEAQVKRKRGRPAKEVTA
jgi:hypothetical protein